ncbi:uncharacterized protein METZ01_LOCUS37424 [marine metagenome]|uniref:Uncharacterized protein n=1 Tax=marine metagenome TaxID=408172 RepID=A0A381QZG2_9ZZZZ
MDGRRIHCDDKTTQAALMGVRSARIRVDDVNVL